MKRFLDCSGYRRDWERFTARWASKDLCLKLMRFEGPHPSLHQQSNTRQHVSNLNIWLWLPEWLYPPVESQKWINSISLDTCTNSHVLHIHPCWRYSPQASLEWPGPQLRVLHMRKVVEINPHMKKTGWWFWAGGLPKAVPGEFLEYQNHEWVTPCRMLVQSSSPCLLY